MQQQFAPLILTAKAQRILLNNEYRELLRGVLESLLFLNSMYVRRTPLLVGITVN